MMYVCFLLLWNVRIKVCFKGNPIHDKSSLLTYMPISGRVVAGAWWIGALIIVQSYTANLAAFLTIKSTGEDITGIDDLAAQTAIRYGTVRGSHIQTYFDTSQRSPIQ